MARATQLNFHTVGEILYPYATGSGLTGTAITSAFVGAQSALAFTTSVLGGGDVVYLDLITEAEISRHPSFPANSFINGMDFDPVDQYIWGISGIAGQNIFSFDPNTGSQISSFDAGPSFTAIGCDGVSVFVSKYDGANPSNLSINVFDKSGTLLSNIPLPGGASCDGLSVFSQDFLIADHPANTVHVLSSHPKGHREAYFTPPGTTNRVDVAFDDQIDYDALLPNAWNPVPWRRKHRIYIANEDDQKIYFGYLY